MLLPLLHAALAAEKPEPTAVTVEPVLDQARRDVKAMRVARTAQVLMIALPGAMVATSFVVANSKRGTPQIFLGGAGVTLSGIGLVIAANVFQKQAINSRERLVAQGLKVPRTPPIVVPVLSSIGLAGTVMLLGNLANDDLLGLAGTGATITAISFASCFGLSTLQLELNRTARKRAGWITFVPTRIDRTTGLAVAGTF